MVSDAKRVSARKLGEYLDRMRNDDILIVSKLSRSGRNQCY